MSSYIKLNIGGTKTVVNNSIIKKIPYIDNLVSANNNNNDHIFIDMNYDHFVTIITKIKNEESIENNNLTNYLCINNDYDYDYDNNNNNNVSCMSQIKNYYDYDYDNNNNNNVSCMSQIKNKCTTFDCINNSLDYNVVSDVNNIKLKNHYTYHKSMNI